MNIQIFGIKKSNDTRKAERFFKERNIQFHFRDLSEKGISPGELENISRVIPVEELIDKEGKQFQKRNLKYMVFKAEEELLNDSLLFKMPIVRNGKLVTVGYSLMNGKNGLNQSEVPSFSRMLKNTEVNPGFPSSFFPIINPGPIPTALKAQ